jgi:hypothetical protein
MEEEAMMMASGQCRGCSYVDVVHGSSAFEIKPIMVVGALYAW